MKPKVIKKICIDLAMTVALLLLMAYQLIGEEAHEWIGVIMFGLFAGLSCCDGAVCGSGALFEQDSTAC